MPAFGGQLTDPDVATLVRYLKGDYYRGPVGEADSKAEAARPEGARCRVRFRYPGFPLNERQNHHKNRPNRLVFP